MQPVYGPVFPNQTHEKLNNKISDWKDELTQNRVAVKQSISNHAVPDAQNVHHLQVTNAMKPEEVFSYLVEEIRDTSPPEELAEVIEKSRVLYTKAIKAEKKVTAKFLKNVKKEIAPVAYSKERSSFEKIWHIFRWTTLTSIIEKHPDCAKFLKESGLLFAIRGYQHSIERRGETLPGEENMKMGIRFDRDDHPLLLKEGEWVRWDVIKKEICFDKKNKELVSTNDPSIEWNYFYPFGLVPGSRYNQVKSIYRLNANEIAGLQEHAARYYEINPDTDPGAVKNCFIQVYTTDRKSQPLGVSHVGVRLIDNEGRIYSLGYEMPTEQQKHITRSAFTILATDKVTIASLDYDEFRPFDDRYVTTIPISAAKAKKILDQMKEYTHQPLRFNYMRQNCARFAVEVLHLAGVSDIKPTANLSEVFARALLPSNIFAVLQKGIEKISSVAIIIFNKMHTHASDTTDALVFVYAVVTFIPRKIGTVAKNILICILGGRKAASPLPPGVEDDRNNDQQLTPFSRVIVHWKDLFDEDLGTLYFPPKITEWQKKQPSTIKHAYEASPALYVAPHQFPHPAVGA